jgi:hypothetical protein
MSELGESREQAVGTHILRFEEPDIYVIRQVDAITASEVKQIFDLVDEFVGDKTHVFAIIDQTNAGGTTSDARRAIIGRMSRAYAGIAFVGVPVMARVGISLGYKAYVMLNRGQEHPHTFTENERQAREWIHARKQAVTKH